MRRRLRPMGFVLALAGILPSCQGRNAVRSNDAAAQIVELVTERWPNGHLRLRKEVVRESDGALVDHGRYIRWHENGRKSYQATFQHGRKVGVATRWHKNGNKWREERYVDGDRHGVSRMWNEEGVLIKEERYSVGKPHGTWTVWKEGRIRWQGHFKNGKAVKPEDAPPNE